MRKMITLVCCAALCLGVAAPIALADHHESAGMKSKSMSMTSAMVDQIKDAKSKLLEIAEATPADKYTWAPSEGVRSFAATFLHVATANYGIPYMMGTNPPEGLDVMGLEKSTTDKAEVMKHLEASFDHVIEVLEGTSAEKMAESVSLFGGFETTGLGAFMIVVTHGHEHLGQSIAYARSNGIVPPWSARQAAAAAEAKKKAGDKADE